MTHANGTPLWEQAAILILGPPIGTCVWWLMSRGFAEEVQEGTVSEETKSRQRSEFWIVLAIKHAISIGLVLYAWLR